jgi:hypothetical protein
MGGHGRAPSSHPNASQQTPTRRPPTAPRPYRTHVPAAEWPDVISASSSLPASAWWTEYQAYADDYVNTTTTPQNLVAVGSGSARFRTSAREIETRIYVLALMHRKTGNSAYFTRAMSEMTNAANMANWTGGEFLDTAHVTLAMAMGFDWFYGAMSSGQRTTVEDAIYNKGLVPGILGFTNNAFWTNDYDSNWVFVCCGALAHGCIAIYERNPIVLDDLLTKCRKSIEGAMGRFTPEGAWAEGPGTYLRYGFGMLGRFIATVEAAYGTTENSFGGLWLKQGIHDVGKFSINSVCPVGLIMNIGDSDTLTGNSDEFYRLSVKANRPEYTTKNVEWNTPQTRAAMYYRSAMDTGATPASVGYPLEDGFTGRGAIISLDFHGGGVLRL